MLLAAVVAAVATARMRTPSPCDVQRLTSNPSMHWLAVDYCRIDQAWRKAKGQRLQMLEAKDALGKLEEFANPNFINGNCASRSSGPLPSLPWYHTHVCGIPANSLCLPRAAAARVAACASADAFVEDSTKMCHCGLLPGCMRQAECMYSHQKLRDVQQQRIICRHNPLQTEHAARVMNSTWSAAADRNVTAALLVLDNCVAAMHAQPSTFAAAYQTYVVEATDAAKKEQREAQTQLNVACLLIRDVDLDMHAPLLGAGPQSMLQRWKLKYCALP